MKLQECINTPAFLAGLVDSGCLIQLRTLELTIKESDHELNWEEDISKFFRAFHSLQELYVQITYHGATYRGISGSISCHCASLRRLVYHERQSLPLDSDDDYGSYEDDDDYQNRLNYRDIGLDSDQDMTPFAKSNFPQMLQNTHLECVGLCERPASLVYIIGHRFWKFNG